MKRNFRLRMLALLAVSGLTAFQAQAAEPAVSPSGEEGAASAPVANEKETSFSKPLIIRGNDKVIAEPKPADGKQTSSEPVSLLFEQSPITEVINTVMGQILKTNYVIHQPINGSITLSTNTPIPVDQVVMVLESAMQANGVMMAQDARGTYHIGRPEALKGVVPAPKRVGNGPLPPGYGTVIIPLKYIGAAEMADILKPVSGAESFVRVDAMRNLLIMAGTRNQIEGWLEMVSTFDVNLLRGMSVGVFPLQYISAKDVDGAIRLMTATMGGKADGSGVLPGIGAMRVLPIERINSVLIVAPRAALVDQARELIAKIDRPMVSESEQQLFVYRVQNGSAAHLSNVLNGIFGGGSTSSANTTTGVAPGLSSTSTQSNALTGTSTTTKTGTSIASGTSTTNRSNTASTAQTAQGTSGASIALGNSNIKVTADDRNNTLVFYCTAAEYKKIENSLRRLDVAQSQVLIEASIIEVTLTGALSYGLQWYFNNNDKWNGTGSLGNVSASTGLASASGTFSYVFTQPFNKFKVFLQASATDSLIKVISSPSLMVLDNQTATINVGDQRPIKSGTTTTTSGTATTTTNFEYRETGVKLAVTPSIYAGDVISMVVNQSLSEVAADSGSGDATLPTILNREVASKVSIRSGETVVMGGLIRSNTSTIDSGVPLLKDIPLIGNLFKTRSKSTNKTELLVMITPRVVRTETDVADVSAELRERMKILKSNDKEINALLPNAAAGSDAKALTAPDVGAEATTGRADVEAK